MKSNYYIPLTECKDKHLYLIDARNGYFGIFEEDKGWFILSRIKYNDNFLYQEYHWDFDKYGTVRPLVDMGIVNIKDENKKLIFLNKKTAELSRNIDINALITIVDITTFKRKKFYVPIFKMAKYTDQFKCCKCTHKIRSKTIYYDGGHGCKIYETCLAKKLCENSIDYIEKQTKIISTTILK